MATKVELQEEALQLEVAIYHPAKEGDEEGTQLELTKAELVTAIAAKTEELQAKHAAEQAAAEEARQPVADEPEPTPKPKRKSKVHVADPSAERLKALGLPPPTDKDRALARKHGYPVAVPGGKAYRTSVSFNCSLSGQLVPIRSVVILTDDQADHKDEFLTPVR